MGSSDPVRLTHEGVLVPSIRFGLVVKSLVLDWCERGVAICRWHDRFGENPMSLVAGVAQVRVPIIVRRTDDTNEGVVTISESVLVLFLVRRTPHRIKDLLTLRRLWGEVGPNWTVVSPHDWFVVLRAPFGRGRQRSLRGDGFEGNTSRFRVPRSADASLGEVLLT